MQLNCQSCVSSQWHRTVAAVILDAGAVSIRDCLSCFFLPLCYHLTSPSQICGSCSSKLAEYGWEFSSVKYEATLIHVSCKASLSFWEKIILAQGIENKKSSEHLSAKLDLNIYIMCLACKWRLNVTFDKPELFSHSTQDPTFSSVSNFFVCVGFWL